MRYTARVVPDVIAVPQGSGMTELMIARDVVKDARPDPPVIQVFPFEKRPVEPEPKKSSRGWVYPSVMIAAFILGATVGGIVQGFTYCIPPCVGALAYIGGVIYANR